MSQVNIQNLLQFGEDIPLGQVSPGSPEYRQSSFQGGGVQVGQAAQQVGPTGEEALYGALAEMAGGVQKGIDTFTAIRTRIEQEEVTEAKTKFKEIFAGEYFEDAIGADGKPVKRYKTPQDKLNEWNSYIKGTSTLLLGDSWIKELNTDAYSAFGSREAQDKFEAERYQREFTSFFADPKRRNTLNPDSPFAKLEFDAYYENKFPASRANGWFATEKLSNKTNFQNLQDQLALQGFDSAIDRVLPMPSVDAVINAVTGAPAERAAIIETYPEFFTEVLPAIRGMTDEKQIAQLIFNRLKTQFIDDNPEELPPHSLELLALRLPVKARQFASVLQTLEVAHNKAQAELAIQQNLETATNSLLDFSNSKGGSEFLGASLSGLGLVPASQQQTAINSTFQNLWSAGFNGTTQRFEKVIKKTRATEFTKEGAEFSPRPGTSAIELAFPQYGKLSEGDINLASFPPAQQFEIVVAQALQEAISANPTILKQLAAVYGGKDSKETMELVAGAVRGQALSSKGVQDATSIYIKDYVDQAALAKRTLALSTSVDQKVSYVDEILSKYSEVAGINKGLFRSIYINQDGSFRAAPLKIENWYSQLSDKDKNTINASPGLYLQQKDLLYKLAVAAFELETEAQKPVDNTSTEKLIEATYKYNGDRKNIEARQTEGNFVTESLSGNIHKNTDEGDKQLRAFVGSFYQVSSSADFQNALIKIETNQPLTSREQEAVSQYGMLTNALAKFPPDAKAIMENILTDTEEMSREVRVTAFAIVRETRPDLLDPKKEQEFQETVQRITEEVVGGSLSGKLPAVTGNIDASKAFENGQLTTFGLTELTRLQYHSYRLASSSTTPIAGQQAYSYQLGSLMGQAIDGLASVQTLESLQNDPNNTIKVLAWAALGRGVHSARQQDPSLIIPNTSGKLIIDLSEQASISESLDLASLINVMGSPSGQRALNSTYNLPFAIALSQNGYLDSENVLLAPAPTNDQMSLIREMRSSSIAFLRGGIFQPDLSQMGLLSEDIKRRIQNGQSVDFSNLNDEAYSEIMQGFFTGTQTSPLNPDWNPNLTLAMWKQSGVLGEEVTKEQFANLLYRSFLEGTFSPTLDDDSKIRYSFAILAELQSKQDKLVTRIGYLVSSPSNPLGELTQSEKATALFDNIAVSVNTHFAIESGRYNEEGVIQMNANTATEGYVENGDYITLLPTVRGPTPNSSYSATALAKTAFSTDPDTTFYFTKLKENADTPNSRFSPETSNDFRKKRDGVPYLAGTYFLESKPTPETIQTVFEPMLRSIFDTDEGVQIDNALWGSILKQAESQPTMMDVFLYVDEEMQKYGHSLIDRTRLYQNNGTKFRPGVSEIIVPNLGFSYANNKRFTFNFVHHGNNGPYVHIPDSVWSGLVLADLDKLKEMRKQRSDLQPKTMRNPNEEYRRRN